MNGKRNYHRAGLTLIELLVAMSISGVIFVAVSSFMVSLFVSNTRSKQLDTIAQTKDSIAKDLSTTIRWAKEVSVSPGEDELTAVMEDGTTYTYTVDSDGMFTKNGTPIHDPSYTVGSFTVRNYSQNALASVEVNLAIRRKNFTALGDTLKLVVSQRQTEVTISN